MHELEILSYVRNLRIPTDNTMTVRRDHVGNLVIVALRMSCIQKKSSQAPSTDSVFLIQTLAIRADHKRQDYGRKAFAEAT